MTTKLSVSKPSFVLCLFLTLLFCRAGATVSAQSPRSVFIVAHRVNTHDIGSVSEQKCNAIEADFMWGTRGNLTGWWLAHDSINNGSPWVDEWLGIVAAQVAKPDNTLCLLWVDIKSPNAQLDELYDLIRKHLPNIYVVFDIGLVADGPKLNPVRSRVLHDSKAAVALGFNDSNTKVDKWCRENNYPIHKYWYEIGLAAGLVGSQTEIDWAKNAISRRDLGVGPKVLYWTVEKEQTVKNWLSDGIDGLIVNSSRAYGRTTALVSDADVHVRNAQNSTIVKSPGKYATPGDNLFLTPPALPKPRSGFSSATPNGANGYNVVLVEKSTDGGREAGQFGYQYNGTWVETFDGGKTPLPWTERSRDQWSVYLEYWNGLDSATWRYLQLDLYQLTVKTPKDRNFADFKNELSYKIGKAHAPTNVTGASLSATASLKKLPNSALWQETLENGQQRKWVEATRDTGSVYLQMGPENYIVDSLARKLYYSQNGFNRDRVLYDIKTIERGEPWMTPATPK